MYLTGFTDEAGSELETQIKAIKELGWRCMSARTINGVNIHDLPEDEFEKVAFRIEEENIKVVEFGSLIGNWAKSIRSDFSITLEEVSRAIPKMQVLGTKIVRVMSYAMEPWGEEQYVEERVRRLREIVSRFNEAGITVAHENCQNYGGFSASHTLDLIDRVSGLKLIYDTGNPVFTIDRSKEKEGEWQDSLEFFNKVKEHVVHIHIKDGLNPISGEREPERYTYPAEGKGHVREILTELKKMDYNGGLAIEPHIVKVFHKSEGNEKNAERCYSSYIAYAQKFELLCNELDITGIA